ncbi:MAG: replication protein [Planctomycetota bacterium]|jgi:hypothetical protein
MRPFHFRKTVGFHIYKDAISLSQFSKACNLTKRAVCKILTKLEQKNIITRERKDTGGSSKFKFNQDFNTWRVGNPCSHVANTGSATSEREFPKVVNGHSHTKERFSPLREKGYLD